MSLLTRPRVPDGLRDLMKDLTKEILKEKPTDIYDFAENYFHSQVPKKEHYDVNSYEKTTEKYDFSYLQNSKRYQVPVTLAYSIIPEAITNLIKDLIKAVLREQPQNLCDFAVQYFRHFKASTSTEAKIESKKIIYSTYESYFVNKERFLFTPCVKCSCGRSISEASTGHSSQNQSNESAFQISQNQTTYPKWYMKSIYMIQRNVRRYLKRKHDTKNGNDFFPNQDGMNTGSETFASSDIKTLTTVPVVPLLQINLNETENNSDDISYTSASTALLSATEWGRETSEQTTSESILAKTIIEIKSESTQDNDDSNPDKINENFSIKNDLESETKELAFNYSALKSTSDVKALGNELGNEEKINRKEQEKMYDPEYNQSAKMQDTDADKIRICPIEEQFLADHDLNAQNEVIKKIHNHINQIHDSPFTDNKDVKSNANSEEFQTKQLTNRPEDNEHLNIEEDKQNDNNKNEYKDPITEITKCVFLGEDIGQTNVNTNEIKSENKTSGKRELLQHESKEHAIKNFVDNSEMENKKVNKIKANKESETLQTDLHKDKYILEKSAKAELDKDFEKPHTENYFETDDKEVTSVQKLDLKEKAVEEYFDSNKTINNCAEINVAARDDVDVNVQSISQNESVEKLNMEDNLNEKPGQKIESDDIITTTSSATIIENEKSPTEPYKTNKTPLNKIDNSKDKIESNIKHYVALTYADINPTNKDTISTKTIEKIVNAPGNKQNNINIETLERNVDFKEEKAMIPKEVHENRNETDAGVSKTFNGESTPIRSANETKNEEVNFTDKYVQEKDLKENLSIILEEKGKNTNEMQNVISKEASFKFKIKSFNEPEANQLNDNFIKAKPRDEMENNTKQTLQNDNTSDRTKLVIEKKLKHNKVERAVEQSNRYSQIEFNENNFLLTDRNNDMPFNKLTYNTESESESENILLDSVAETASDTETNIMQTENRKSEEVQKVDTIKNEKIVNKLQADLLKRVDLTEVNEDANLILVKDNTELLEETNKRSLNENKNSETKNVANEAENYLQYELLAKSGISDDVSKKNIENVEWNTSPLQADELNKNEIENKSQDETSISTKCDALKATTANSCNLTDIPVNDPNENIKKLINTELNTSNTNFDTIDINEGSNRSNNFFSSDLNNINTGDSITDAKTLKCKLVNETKVVVENDVGPIEKAIDKKLKLELKISPLEVNKIDKDDQILQETGKSSRLLEESLQIQTDECNSKNNEIGDQFINLKAVDKNKYISKTDINNTNTISSTKSICEITNQQNKIHKGMNHIDSEISFEKTFILKSAKSTEIKNNSEIMNTSKDVAENDSANDIFVEHEVNSIEKLGNKNKMDINFDDNEGHLESVKKIASESRFNDKNAKESTIEKINQPNSEINIRSNQLAIKKAIQRQSNIFEQSTPHDKFGNDIEELSPSDNKSTNSETVHGETNKGIHNKSTGISFLSTNKILNQTLQPQLEKPMKHSQEKSSKNITKEKHDENPISSVNNKSNHLHEKQLEDQTANDFHDTTNNLKPKIESENNDTAAKEQLKVLSEKTKDDVLHSIILTNGDNECKYNLSDFKVSSETEVPAVKKNGSGDSLANQGSGKMSNENDKERNINETTIKKNIEDTENISGTSEQLTSMETMDNINKPCKSPIEMKDSNENFKNEANENPSKTFSKVNHAIQAISKFQESSEINSETEKNENGTSVSHDESIKHTGSKKREKADDNLSEENTYRKIIFSQNRDQENEMPSLNKQQIIDIKVQDGKEFTINTSSNKNVQHPNSDFINATALQNNLAPDDQVNRNEEVLKKHLEPDHKCKNEPDIEGINQQLIDEHTDAKPLSNEVDNKKSYRNALKNNEEQVSQTANPKNKIDQQLNKNIDLLDFENTIEIANTPLNDGVECHKAKEVVATLQTVVENQNKDNLISSGKDTSTDLKVRIETEKPHTDKLTNDETKVKSEKGISSLATNDTETIASEEIVPNVLNIHENETLNLKNTDEDLNRGNTKQPISNDVNENSNNQETTQNIGIQTAESNIGNQNLTIGRIRNFNECLQTRVSGQRFAETHLRSFWKEYLMNNSAPLSQYIYMENEPKEPESQQEQNSNRENKITLQDHDYKTNPNIASTTYDLKLHKDFGTDIRKFYKEPTSFIIPIGESNKQHTSKHTMCDYTNNLINFNLTGGAGADPTMDSKTPPKSFQDSNKSPEPLFHTITEIKPANNLKSIENDFTVNLEETSDSTKTIGTSGSEDDNSFVSDELLETENNVTYTIEIPSSSDAKHKTQGGIYEFPKNYKHDQLQSTLPPENSDPCDDKDLKTIASNIIQSSFRRYMQKRVKHENAMEIKHKSIETGDQLFETHNNLTGDNDSLDTTNLNATEDDSRNDNYWNEQFNERKEFNPESTAQNLFDGMVLQKELKDANNVFSNLYSIENKYFVNESAIQQEANSDLCNSNESLKQESCDSVEITTWKSETAEEDSKNYVNLLIQNANESNYQFTTNIQNKEVISENPHSQNNKHEPNDYKIKIESLKPYKTSRNKTYNSDSDIIIKETQNDANKVLKRTNITNDKTVHDPSKGHAEQTSQNREDLAARKIQNAFKKFFKQKEIKTSKSSWFIGDEQIIANDTLIKTTSEISFEETEAYIELTTDTPKCLVDSSSLKTIDVSNSFNSRQTAPVTNRSRSSVDLRTDHVINISKDTIAAIATGVNDNTLTEQSNHEDNSSVNGNSLKDNDEQPTLAIRLQKKAFHKNDSTLKYKNLIDKFINSERQYTEVVNNNNQQADNTKYISRSCLTADKEITADPSANTDTSSTSDVDDTEDSLSTKTVKLHKPDMTITKMQQRRESTTKVLVLDKPKDYSFDEPLVVAIDNLDTDEEGVVITKLHREDTRESDYIEVAHDENFPVKGSLKRVYTIAEGNDAKLLLKNVTIDESIKYIEPPDYENNSGSLCLDDETAENIRRKMMAYSLSGADSDCFDKKPRNYDNSSFLPRSENYYDFNVSATQVENGNSSTETVSTIVSAVTKIQARTRGYLTRKRLGRTSANSDCKHMPHDELNKASFGNAAITESLEYLVQETAAKKIQKVYRNYYRKKLAEGKPEEDKQILPEFGARMDNNLAQKRSAMFQRGVALRNNSTQDDNNSNECESNKIISKTLSSSDESNHFIKQHLGENTSCMDSSTMTSEGKTAAEIRAKKIEKHKMKWLAMRQNSMPVQIDSEVLRVIPKQMRKKIKSAEGEKKKNKQLKE